MTVGLILLLSTLVHFTYLSYPRGISFDEVGYGGAINNYCCTKRRFFDIHPPLPKLIITLTAWAGGYRGEFRFKQIGKPFAGTRVYALRSAPALFGTFLPLLIFLLLRQLGVSLAAAFLVALCVIFDNAIALQTRVIATEAMLLTGIFGSISSFLAMETQKTFLGRLSFQLLCGVSWGLALGTKFTGLVAPALIIGLSLFRFSGVRPKSERLGYLTALFLILGIGTATYLLGWWWHFHLLTLPGSGDRFFRPTGSFFSDVIQIHIAMLKANYNLPGQHFYGSRWWQWPFMKSPIFYWSGFNRRAYLVGNPVVWWGTSVILLMALSKWIRDIRLTRRSLDFPISLAVTGYFVSYLPYAVIPRTLFLYHYMPPLLFSLIAAALYADQIGWTRDGVLSRQRPGFYFAIASLIIAFALMSPITFGISNWPIAEKRYIDFVEGIRGL